MSHRDDIILGLRGGALLLAVLFAGVGAYRIARETPAVAKAPPAPAVRRTEQPAPKVHAAASAGPAVPPPPPARRAMFPVRVEAAVPEDSTIVQEPLETPSAAVEAPAPEAPHKTISSPPDAPAVEEDEPAPKEGRAKRAIKAVGRFLHIVRQPNLD